jgi:hypothetical protein
VLFTGTCSLLWNEVDLELALSDVSWVCSWSGSSASKNIGLNLDLNGSIIISVSELGLEGKNIPSCEGCRESSPLINAN